VLFGCSTSTSSKAAEPWPLRVTPLTSPATGDSAEPQLTVRGDRVILSWVETSGDRAMLKFAERTGDGWSQARTVSSGTNFFVNPADVPSVVRLADGSLAAHWLQTTSESDDEAYDVRLSFSKDDGQTWSASTTPHHDGKAVEHGFASLFQAPGQNGLGLIWLDGREMKSDGHGAMGGNMTLRAATFDGSGSQASETRVGERVCECCPTAVAETSDGPIVAFRNRTEDEIRDIYVSRFAGGRWSNPTAVHDDHWKINACPVNGPALSARGRNVAIAWFTGTGDRGHVFAAFSNDSGKTFAAPIAIEDAGTEGRVAVELLATGSAIVSWVEFADQRSQVRIRQIDPSGARTESLNVASNGASRASGYPRMAVHGDELLLAWTDPSGYESQVKTAVASLRK
jgi:hypothetical protein